MNSHILRYATGLVTLTVCFTFLSADDAPKGNRDTLKNLFGGKPHGVQDRPVQKELQEPKERNAPRQAFDEPVLRVEDIPRSQPMPKPTNVKLCDESVSGAIVRLRSLPNGKRQFFGTAISDSILLTTVVAIHSDNPGGKPGVVLPDGKSSTEVIMKEGLMDALTQEDKVREMRRAIIANKATYDAMSSEEKKRALQLPATLTEQIQQSIANAEFHAEAVAFVVFPKGTFKTHLKVGDLNRPFGPKSPATYITHDPGAQNRFYCGNVPVSQNADATFDVLPLQERALWNGHLGKLLVLEYSGEVNAPHLGDVGLPLLDKDGAIRGVMTVGTTRPSIYSQYANLKMPSSQNYSLQQILMLHSSDETNSNEQVLAPAKIVKLSPVEEEALNLENRLVNDHGLLVQKEFNRRNGDGDAYIEKRIAKLKEKGTMSKVEESTLKLALFESFQELVTLEISPEWAALRLSHERLLNDWNKKHPAKRIEMPKIKYAPIYKGDE